MRKIIIVLFFVFVSNISFAYDDKTTHPALTNNAADFYNLYFEKKLTNQEKEWLISGSIKEDTPPRWINHFYDPVYQEGWTGEHGPVEVSQDLLQRFSDVFLSPESSVPAPNWARNQELQAKYYLYEGNRAWERAIYEYVKNNNKEEAYKCLGHILHLIQDMAVPEHTRNDTHTGDSPYENYASKFNRNNFYIVNDLKNRNEQPIKLNSLNGYFENLSLYSNNYFFSKDTINDEKYSKPKIISESKIYAYGLDEDKNEFILAKRDEKINDYIIEIFYSLEEGSSYIPILDAYWARLSKEAILESAGVINLFYQEVAKAENNPDIIPQLYQPSPITAIRNIFVSPFGEFSRLASAYNKTKTFLANAFESALNLFSNQPAAPVMIASLPSPVPSLLPTPTPSLSLSPGPAFISSPFPAFTPVPSIAPSLSPTPTPSLSPTLRVGLDGLETPEIIEPKFSAALPYPGFGGGGGGIKSEIQNPKSETNSNDQNSNTENEELESSPEPTPEPVPEITPSPSPTPIPEPEYMDIVINEIAWMGTSASPYDEWIELHNRTDYKINLDGLVLYSETDMSPYINLSGIISANGYFLIERKTESKISSQIFDNDGNPIADLFVNFSHGLNNIGEVLVLSCASTTIDRTIVSSPYNRWPAGDSDNKFTMERVNPDLPGNDLSNWARNAYPTVITNGKDANNSRILGTPKARNSVSYLIANGSPVISSDITLKKSSSPYIVNNQIQVFQDNAVLNIEPGVVIKFYNDAGLRFSGNSKIIAKGTADEPIVFTSFDDDEYGGDTNNNSTTTAPHPGAWFGVEVETSNSDSVFENSIFRYGGKYYSGWGIFNSLGPSDLHIKGTSAQIANSIFEYSKGYGLYLANSSSTVSNSIIRNNKGSNPAGYNAGIMISGGAPKIQNNTISNNGYGISMASDEAIIDSNVFDSNEREAIVSNGLSSVFTNNSGSNNFINAIAVSGELARENTTTTARANPLPYYFWMVSVASSSTLIIEPGTVIKGSYNNPVNIYGNLIIAGASGKDIVFTSLYDDSASRGDWMGIVMKPGSYSEISGVTFKYADTALTYQNSPINLSDVKFINNSFAIIADAYSVVQAVATSTLEFIDNTNDVSPADLW